MTHPPLPASAALVSALRAAPLDAAAAGALRTRVHSRLAVALLGLAPPIGVDLPDGGASLVAPKTSGIAFARSAAVGKRLIVASLAPVFALGVVTGVIAERWNQQGASYAAPQIAAAQSPPDGRSTAQPGPAPEAITPRELEEVHEAKRPEPTSPSSLPSNANVNLTAERNLLDEARKALARGEAQKGFAPLERHAKRFPKGVLTEEREALAVRLLAALGQTERATRRAENFHRRFPNSLFTPAVDNALATIPRQNTENESNP